VRRLLEFILITYAVQNLSRFTFRFDLPLIK